MQNITGYISAPSRQSIRGVIQGNLHVNLDPVANNLPLYNGVYEVTPTATTQELATSKTVLRDNIRISGIPFSEIINSSGGLTAVIGG